MSYKMDDTTLNRNSNLDMEELVMLKDLLWPWEAVLGSSNDLIVDWLEEMVKCKVSSKKEFKNQGSW